MIHYKQLNDPIEMTHEMDLREFQKYVEIANRQKILGTFPDKDLVDEIGARFYYSNSYAPKGKIDEVWNTVGPVLAKNEALVAFTLDYNGEKSRYFFPWLKSVWTSQSEALETAYNEGYDVAGNWCEDIPNEDYISYFVHNDPTFVYNRERELEIADLALSMRDQAKKGEISRVLDFGAGRMAWIRHTGFKPAADKQEIIAFDSDKTIDPAKLFGVKNPKKELGIDFRCADIKQALQDTKLDGTADLIILSGVATYLPEGLLTVVLSRFYDMLKPHGKIFFDLQLNCPYLQRSMKVFNWAQLNLPENPALAVQKVEDSYRKPLASAGKKFGAKYQVDTYNKVPSALMVELSKN